MGGFLKRHFIRVTLGLAVVVLFLGNATHSLQLPLLQKLEAIAYDTRLELTMPRTMDNKIVILDIDEKSLAEKENGGEGHWPWSRDRLALLLDKLFDRYHVAVVGFDIVFSERDESSGLPVLQELARKELKNVSGFDSALKQLQPRLDYDQIFASRMRDRPVVLGYAFSRPEDKTAIKGAVPQPVLPEGAFAGRGIDFRESYSGYVANLAELQGSAALAGHFNVEPDGDGVIRRVPILIEYNGAYYEPLSLAVARLWLGSPQVKPGFPSQDAATKQYAGLEWIEAGPIKIPVDESVTALVPYRGSKGSFKYISVVDVLHDRVDVADLKDKIVLVGTTALGLFDLRNTPVGAAYPGVEVHANMISGMIDGTIKQKPSYVMGAEFALLLFAGLILALLLPLLTPLKSLLVTVIALAVVTSLNLIVFQYGNLVLPLASGLAMIVLLFGLNMSYGYFVEARGKRQITGLFGQYVPPELVDEMAKNPASFSMEGKSLEMTVLFTDVREFTTISERLDPRQLSQLMNEFLTSLTEVVYKHRGTVDKFIGDCIMAFWGAPLESPTHARNGILAALAMREVVKNLKVDFQARGWPEIRIGVGINTGRMSVGNMGSKLRTAYTVMGDAVNVAARLEGLTRDYDADIIVGEATKNAVPDIVFREVDRVRVKGKDEAVAIYEPLGLQGQVPPPRLEEAKLYAQFLRLYRAQEWDQAELHLFNLKSVAPDNMLYSITFSERISYLRTHPPGEAWDGAFTFKTK